MKTISVREVARRVGIAWRTALDRLKKGRIPGKMAHPSANRGWVVLSEPFEKWAKKHDL